MRLSSVFLSLVTLCGIFLGVSMYSVPVYAQYDNQYDCRYNDSDFTCEVNTNYQGGHGCNELAGYRPDPSVCASVGDDPDPRDCTALVNQPCIPPTEEEEEEIGRCTYSQGACIPSPAGEFATCQACLDSIEEPAERGFSCPNRNEGCVPCSPGSPGCNLDATQCAEYCVPASTRPTPGPPQTVDGVTCDGDTGINTGIGCIPFEPVALTRFFLGWALGVGGGIALLMIGFAGITIMTSAGDPKKMAGGQQLLTAAISGLLLIIFSTFILRFFGVTLFGIF